MSNGHIYEPTGNKDPWWRRLTGVIKGIFKSHSAANKTDDSQRQMGAEHRAKTGMPSDAQTEAPTQWEKPTNDVLGTRIEKVQERVRKRATADQSSEKTASTKRPTRDEAEPSGQAAQSRATAIAYKVIGFGFMGSAMIGLLPLLFWREEKDHNDPHFAWECCGMFIWFLFCNFWGLLFLLRPHAKSGQSFVTNILDRLAKMVEPVFKRGQAGWDSRDSEPRP